MNELHILNVGRADCSVFFLNSEQGKKTVVLDGGELSWHGHQPLLEFLEERKIKTVDLMILTHLHQDHFGGFHQLIDKIKVEALVAPCGDLVFHEAVYPIFGDREFYREYHRIFQYFQRSGTKMCTSVSCGGKKFAFGENVLHCLYPSSDAPMRSVARAKELCQPDLDEREMMTQLELYKQACNEDSSIWLLTNRGTDIALMAGDSPDQTLRMALERYGPVHPVIQKLSHHGINPLYFSEETQKMTAPKILVVTVDKEHYNNDMQKHMEKLGQAGNSQVRFTFQGTFAYYF